jgi:DNA-directed RNA polymerase
MMTKNNYTPMTVLSKTTTQAEWELQLLDITRNKTLNSQELISKLIKVLTRNGQHQLASLHTIPNYFKRFNKEIVKNVLGLSKGSKVGDDEIFLFISVCLTIAIEFVMQGNKYRSKLTLATAVTGRIYNLALASQYMTQHEYKSKTLINSRAQVGWSHERINNMMTQQARKLHLAIPYTKEELLNEVNLGVQCVALTQLFHWMKIPNNRQILVLNDWVVEELDKVVDVVISRTSIERAMVEEPIPYNMEGVGGYHTPILQSLAPMYSGMHGLPPENTECLQRYVQTINYMQKTEWELNRPILTLLRKLTGDPEYLIQWQHTFFGVLPFNTITDDMPKGLQKKLKQENDRGNRVVEGLHYTLREALMYEEAETLWFTWFIDYRGRFYPRAGLLSPQGNKIAKALLQFKNGSRLLSQRQVDLYKMEVVKMFGFDKLPLPERLNKFTELEPIILEVGEAVLKGEHPEHHKVWGGNKESVQCLAYCVEWFKIHKNPLGSLVHLPVTIDGTCNGLQHISAMLLDKDMGESVNLLPSDKPQDIYGEAVIIGKRNLVQLDVMKYAEDKLNRDRNKKLKDKKQEVPEVTIRDIKKYAAVIGEVKQFWLRQDLTRKITKTAVMTIPYGSTIRTQRENILQNIGMFPIPQDETGKQLVIYKEVLIDCFALGVAEATKSADKLQKFLRSYIKDMQEASPEKDSGIDMFHIFNSPFGLPITSPRKGVAHEEIVKLGVKFPSLIRRLRISELPKTFVPNIEKLKSGCSPNLIHSYDSCHLIMTLEKFEFQYGDQNVWMVHDSYGCSPAHMEVMMTEARNMFVELHKEYPLNSCLQHPYKMLQSYGGLDLEEVKKSDYFFH